MAKIQDTTKVNTSSFNKGLNKDADPSFVGEGMWTHARNAVNNTLEGDLGAVSNETSNAFCAEAGSTIGDATSKRYIIGAVYLYSDKWFLCTVVYNSTGIGAPIGHEIGLYEEDYCRYRIIAQDPCFNFSKYNLISGASRETEDCTWAVYFADGNNPDRIINIGDPKTWPPDSYSWFGNNQYTNGSTIMQWPGVAWDQFPTVVNNCTTYTDLQTVNCDAIRLARLMITPCLKVNSALGAGTLRNGSYQACIAYSIKGQKVTDYFSLSNTQPIYHPQDLSGSIDIEISADSVHFDEFILVVIQTINQGTVAKQIGIYSTKTTLVHLDQIKEDLVSVPIEQIPIQTPIFEKSDQIIEVNNYLLRVGPTSKFDFNYQPLANLIETQWVSVEYPADYYIKGGYKPSFLRDEVYSFFIRWVYSTGDKSASYHIPGRSAELFDVGGGLYKYENESYVGNQNTLVGDTKVFQTFNTASQFVSPVTPIQILEDGGRVVAKGKMAYWESTEIYPDNRPDIWNSSYYCWTDETNPKYDLCGQLIRHHKFPDNASHNVPDPLTNHFSQGGKYIRLLGVDFSNIICPKDNVGKDIPGIVGYEILRGSREGNRSVIAKGMLNNMRTYNILGNASNATGLYPNYPFNTIKPTLTSDGYVYNDPYIRTIDGEGNTYAQSVPTNLITFHSPDTGFRNPFLSASELKVYGNISGASTQQFILPDKHPQFKLVGNLVIFPMFLAGIIEGIISLGGKYTVNKAPLIGPGYDLLLAGNSVPTQLTTATTLQTYLNLPVVGYNNAMKLYFKQGGLVADAITGAFTGVTPIKAGIDAVMATNMQIAVVGGGIAPNADLYTQELPKLNYVDPVTRVISALSQFTYYFTEGAELALRVVYAALPYRDYALQSIAHGFYSTFNRPIQTDTNRFNVNDGFYIKDAIQEVPEFNNKRYRINNLKRCSSVVLRTTNNQDQDVGPALLTGDNSLMTLGNAITNGANLDWADNRSNPFTAGIKSHYAGIKYRIDNQYGQLNSIKQITITPCEQKLSDSNVEDIATSTSCPLLDDTTSTYQLHKRVINNTPIFFGGDTYINRYTEKNNMFFFYDWLYGQPDGFEYNYILRQMIPQPRFWLNSQKYDLNSLGELITDLGDIWNLANDIKDGTGPFPTSYYSLDQLNYDYVTNKPGDYPGFFGVKESYFYLANSSIRDFFVESEVIVDFREAGDYQWEKVYNPYNYTDYQAMFNINPENITKDNYYAYDYSLSLTKIFTQYFSQGSLQSRYYDPTVAKLCYTYYPDRIIYSLPQTQESFKDSWYIYLANNYKEFKTQLSGVKNFAKTGIFITFKNSSPLVFQGVDQLQTEAGTKITIGDGGLFNQTPQNVVIADDAYEYGSSQNRRSVISTPAGMYYMSQNQGKIFSYTQGLSEISANGLKWWFNIFMPYQLTKDFPNYPHVDNPVGGIGCQSIYDNQNSILYFCKKDYKLKEKYKGRVEFNENKNAFILDGTVKYDLGSMLFEDASWTVSYDPKTKFWISFHDWHPDLVLPSKNTFITTKFSKLYFHNNICNSYCNFYGVDYPFEIEVPISTGQTVTTLRSVEYIMEAVRRADNCFDQFQVLDYNFDKAVIYNAEQVSGYLNLNLFPKNNVTLSLQYPKLNNATVIEPGLTYPAFDILFSKEENKYRFNQFWDITKDRGEFPIGSTYPPTGPVIPGTTILAGPHAQENLWITQSNGYIKTLNQANLDYNKNLLQRKKFRDYLNYLYLRKDVSGPINMVVKLASTKNQISLR